MERYHFASLDGNRLRLFVFFDEEMVQSASFDSNEKNALFAGVCANTPAGAFAGLTARCANTGRSNGNAKAKIVTTAGQIRMNKPFLYG
jgi:hypothetical protein